jgi:hypothetical protein
MQPALHEAAAATLQPMLLRHHLLLYCSDDLYSSLRQELEVQLHAQQLECHPAGSVWYTAALPDFPQQQTNQTYLWQHHTGKQILVPLGGQWGAQQLTRAPKVSVLQGRLTR